jgi:hypothetical protein
MNKFASDWTRFHPKGPPVARILRQAEPERWVRFHWLPLSKRYATSQREKWTVLDRANKLASRVLGENSCCWLVQAERDYGDAANDADTYGTIAEYRLTFEFEYPRLEDDCTYRVFAAPVNWAAGAFNDLITKRADDALPPILWVSATTGAAFAPYDGGTDLFLPTAAEVANLKREFSDWLSDHPDCL